MCIPFHWNMRYGSLGCIQKLLLVRNVDLVSSLPRSKQPRYQVSLLPLLRSGEREGREWGGGGGGGKREIEGERREGTIRTRLDSQTNNILFVYFNWRPKDTAIGQKNPRYFGVQSGFASFYTRFSALYVCDVNFDCFLRSFRIVVIVGWKSL